MIHGRSRLVPLALLATLFIVADTVTAQSRRDLPDDTRQSVDALSNWLNQLGPTPNPSEADYNKFFFTPIEEALFRGDMMSANAHRQALANYLRQPGNAPARANMLRPVHAFVIDNDNERVGDPKLVMMAALIADIGSPVSLAVMVDMLDHPDAGVRFSGASGLQRIVQTTTTRPVPAQITSMTQAAINETSGSTLEMIGSALALMGDQAAQDALVEILSQRATKFYGNPDAPAAPTAAGGDAAIAGTLLSIQRSGNLSGENRQKLVAAVPNLLRTAAKQYASQENVTDDQKLGLLRLTQEADSLALAIMQLPNQDDPQLSNAAVSEFFADPPRSSTIEALTKWTGPRIDGQTALFDRAPWGN